MEPAANGHRFPFKRIAITAPPDGWFHGIARSMYNIYREELVALGFDIFDVRTTATNTQLASIRLEGRRPTT